ncbi:zinc-dependent metalloprotease [Schaalia sp. 19OD2882]|nr:zinc-dependent metalloprotease [Schaalia sp. 19OD2882]
MRTPGQPDDGQDPTERFEELLRGMLGADAAAEALHAMRAQGFDPSELGGHVPSVADMQAALGQFKHLMDTTTGPVNWRVAADIARQRAWGAGDPTPTAVQAERAKQAMTVADLWLDTVTDLGPGTVTRMVWNRTQWVSQTLDVWKRVCEPVASNVSRALSEAMGGRLGPSRGDEDGAPFADTPLPEGMPESMRALLGQTREIMPKLAAVSFAHQIGNALAALAGDSFGATDVGLPLAPQGSTALVVSGVEAFADGLDIPYEEVLQFLAVRECAHHRLFHAVPWLAGDLVRAVETYSSHIALDTESIASAARHFDPSDPSSMETALSGGIFASEPTAEQRASLARLETLLALIEGWVEVVSARATAPYLPHGDQLREMMRRRRASGAPAEQVFGQLIGLQMRPRKARGAASIFQIVEADGGVAARDALWAHPHVVPTSEDLDQPDAFLVMRRAAAEQDAEIDQALARMLDGTLGWADGLGPDLPAGGAS